MYSIKKLMVNIIMTINKGQSWTPVSMFDMFMYYTRTGRASARWDRRAEIAANKYNNYSETLRIPSSKMFRSNLFNCSCDLM